MKNNQPDFIIDYDLVHRCYPNDAFHSGVSNCFYPAHLATNEYLRKFIPVYGNTHGDILTVAASGDQPIYYVLNGARRVDTFDMTFCARVVMDLKMAALINLSHVRYHKFIEDLHIFQYKRKDIMEIEDMHLLLPRMPQDSAEFIQKMSRCDIFCAGIERVDFPYWISRTEHKKFNQNIKMPLNFIWSDITELHTKLNTKYDIINISNIFDWIKSGQIEPTARNLFAYLKPGGILLATAFRPYSLSKTILSDIAANSNLLAEFNRVFCTSQEVVLMLKRVR